MKTKTSIDAKCRFAIALVSLLSGTMANANFQADQNNNTIEVPVNLATSLLKLTEAEALQFCLYLSEQGKIQFDPIQMKIGVDACAIDLLRLQKRVTDEASEPSQDLRLDVSDQSCERVCD